MKVKHLGFIVRNCNRMRMFREALVITCSHTPIPLVYTLSSKSNTDIGKQSETCRTVGKAFTRCFMRRRCLIIVRSKLWFDSISILWGIGAGLPFELKKSRKGSFAVVEWCWVWDGQNQVGY